MTRLKRERLFKELKKEYEKLTTTKDKREFKNKVFQLDLTEELLSDCWDYVCLNSLEKNNYLKREY